MIRTHRKHLAVIIGLVCSLFFAGAALAEGSFSSSIAGGRVGFQSRRWTDKHLDNANTTVTFQNCRDSNNNPNTSVKTHVWRDIPLAPDEDRGAFVLNCGVSATGNWGPVPNAGDYYFQIDAISGRTDTNISVNVPGVFVNY